MYSISQILISNQSTVCSCFTEIWVVEFHPYKKHNNKIHNIFTWENNYTGWGKIPSLLSVGHCEGRGGRTRVGLGSKGAGSWEVPITTLRSRKDGVVQRAARICHQNLLFAKSLYRSGAACIPYTLPNPPSELSTRPKIHSVVGWELQGNRKCVWKEMRTTTDLSNTREYQGCQTVRFGLPGALHVNNGHHLQDILFKTMWFKTSHVVVSESKNKIFVSRIVFLLFTLKFREVILPHSVIKVCAAKHTQTSLPAQVNGKTLFIPHTLIVYSNFSRIRSF